MIASAVGWPDVAIALIVAIPSIIAAFYARHNSKDLRTGNDKTVGQMVTEVHGEASTEATPYETHWPDSETGAP